MDNETREKVAKLPQWAQQLIKHLEARPDALVKECAELRKKVSTLDATIRRKNNEISVLGEFIQCAAKGEHEIAKAVKGIVDSYMSYAEDEKVKVTIGRTSGPVTDDEVSMNLDAVPGLQEMVKDVLALVNSATQNKEKWYVSFDDGPTIPQSR